MAFTTQSVPPSIGTNIYDSVESVNDALTATSGGGQTNAQVLVAQFNRFSTVSAGSDSAKLQLATFTPATLSSIGAQVWVMNSGANSMQIFGSSPDKINDVATGTGVAVAAGKSAIFTLVNITSGVGNWYMQLGA